MTAEESTPRTTRSMMTSGPFARFFWAAVIGSTGDWVTVFALLTLANRIGSQEGILVALMARILPGLLLGGVVGVISDRMDRRKLVVLADVGRGLIVPFLALVDNLPVLVGLTLVLEMLSLLGQTPRAAMVPRLVRPENLVTANSLMLGAAYGTVVMGPLLLLILAGFPGVSLGGFIPTGNEALAVAFAVDALTFFASGFLVATLPKIESPLVAEQGNNNVDLKSTWRDFADGIKLFATDKSIRRVIVGMTTALFGGGMVIVLGPEFAQNVLLADDAGFYAIVTMLGVGALAGLVLASINEDRISHRDLAFGLATSAAGVGLSAAAMVTTVPGAAAWMTVVGFGAGAAYLMGLTHLHEYVGDELRGRVLATLFALMRIGLFVAMALAVPLVDLFRGIDIGRLNDPTRVVLFLGGLTMLVAGLGVLWALRSTIRSPTLGLEAKDIIAAANRARRRQPPVRQKSEEEES
ncbi:MAG: MFS transporter [Acidimicrobiia bacterium]|nr:MFS transporter [Acidimicrobiia bacterium]